MPAVSWVPNLHALHRSLFINIASKFVPTLFCFNFLMDSLLSVGMLAALKCLLDTLPIRVGSAWMKAAVTKYSRALIATIQNNKTEGIFMFILLRYAHLDTRFCRLFEFFDVARTRISSSWSNKEASSRSYATSLLCAGSSSSLIFLSVTNFLRAGSSSFLISLSVTSLLRAGSSSLSILNEDYWKRAELHRSFDLSSKKKFVAP